MITCFVYLMARCLPYTNTMPASLIGYQLLHWILLNFHYYRCCNIKYDFSLLMQLETLVYMLSIYPVQFLDAMAFPIAFRIWKSRLFSCFISSCFDIMPTPLLCHHMKTDDDSNCKVSLLPSATLIKVMGFFHLVLDFSFLLVLPLQKYTTMLEGEAHIG